MKCFETNKPVLELLNQLRKHEVDHKNEFEVLKGYIQDLKARIPVYIPVKSDPIDVLVAEFINGYKHRAQMRLMFIRVDDGVYEFGGQKLLLREQRGVLKVKIGGGFCEVEEYLNQYTPAELEKLERKDPLK